MAAMGTPPPLSPSYGLRRVDAIVAVADAEQAELRAEVHTYHDRAMASEAAEASWQARAEAAEARVARVEAALDVRTRARAWMMILGYEDDQIDKAEAWRQPREPWLQEDPPMAVVDLETAAGIAREYEEAIRAALYEHKHLGPVCECGAALAAPERHVCPECEQGKHASCGHGVTL